jgi:hypothetical protein
MRCLHRKKEHQNTYDQWIAEGDAVVDRMMDAQAENDHALAMEAEAAQAEEAALAEAMEANAAGQGALYQDEPLEMEF